MPAAADLPTVDRELDRSQCERDDGLDRRAPAGRLDTTQPVVYASVTCYGTSLPPR